MPNAIREDTSRPPTARLSLMEPLEGRRLLAGVSPDVVARALLADAAGVALAAGAAAPTPVTSGASNASVALDAASAAAAPFVTDLQPAPGESAVRTDAFVAAYVNLPNVGHGVAGATLNAANVRLYRADDAGRTPVPATLNTTGGGDAVVLTPRAPLTAFTRYTFEIMPGLTDTSGAAFRSYQASFTTGAAVATVKADIGFEKVSLPTASGQRFSALAIGPDARLYAGTLDGRISRFDIRADGTLSAPATIDAVRAGNGGGRIITGIRFDPASTAGNLIAWVSHGHPAEEGAPDWSGKLSRLSGPDLGLYQDYVTGLPRSVRDHLNNQMDFGADGKLYLSQGSNTASGAPDNTWGRRPERLLSAAILRVDTGAIAARLAAGRGALDVSTPEDSGYDPTAAGAPVTLYATGVRNAYDLVWHSNGALYAPNNGSAPGGNTPAGGGAPGLASIARNEPDSLLNVRPGRYYGHPNPARGEYVLNGGNPTSGPDRQEIAAYPVGTAPESNWDPAAYDFGANRSPNGVIEYRSGAFGGRLKGSLLVCRYSGGDDILVLTPGASREVPASSARSGIPGLGGFVDPLDLVEHVGPGNLYVIEHGAGKITLLRPAATAPPAPPVIDPARPVFADPIGGAASAARTLTIRNPGGSPLTLTAFSLVGAGRSSFRITDAPQLPLTLAPGATAEVAVTFTPKGGSPGVRTATLRAATSDAAAPQLDFALRGVATAGLTGANEPSLQRLLDLYELPIRAGDANPATSAMPLPLAPGNDAVHLQTLVKAGSGPVTIEPLAVFASAGTPTIRFGHYDPQTGQATEVLTIATSQGVEPPLASGTRSFDPGAAAFGLYADAPAFRDRRAYSEDARNVWEPVASDRRKALFFPLQDRSGAVVPDAFVVGWEEVSGSYDYQDFVAVVRNVRDADAPLPPPHAGPSSPGERGRVTGLTLVNADSGEVIAPFADGAVINYAALPTRNLSVVAETNGAVGSVRFGLDDDPVFQTENFAPHAIRGDDPGRLRSWTPAAGAHTMTVRAYEGSGATGTLLSGLSLTFRVVGPSSAGTLAV